MRTVIYSTLTCLALLTLTVPLRADDASDKKKDADPSKVVYTADSAFDFLKTLAGKWDRKGKDHDHGDSDGAHGSVFRNTAGGSSVMETIAPGEAMEMISVYHKDGDDLLLTHYCALQNAPVMKFQKSDKPGEIKFVFNGGTNFDPKSDDHVHEGTIRVKDANTLEMAFVAYSGGKPTEMPTGTLERAKDDKADDKDGHKEGHKTK